MLVFVSFLPLSHGACDEGGNKVKAPADMSSIPVTHVEGEPQLLQVTL